MIWLQNNKQWHHRFSTELWFYLISWTAEIIDKVIWAIVNSVLKLTPTNLPCGPFEEYPQEYRIRATMIPAPMQAAGIGKLRPLIIKNARLLAIH